MSNDDKYKYCEHQTYGVGYALWIKPRKNPTDDLWMVTFQSTGHDQKWFFCTKHFNLKEEIEFIDEARANELYKQGRNGGFKKRTKNVRKEPKNFGDLLDSLF